MASPGIHEYFSWHTTDVRCYLPARWQQEILDTVEQQAVVRYLTPVSVTSREVNTDQDLSFSVVGGLVIARALPWLHDLYQGSFRLLAQYTTDEPVIPAEDIDYGITLNVQRGNRQTYECHVDSNPVQALLYATTHNPGEGGELVVANQGDVPDRQSVDVHASRVYPFAGYLITFDARHNSHYVAPLKDPGGIRIVAAMTYYTPSSPEADRPTDLKAHVFGSSLEA